MFFGPLRRLINQLLPAIYSTSKGLIRHNKFKLQMYIFYNKKPPYQFNQSNTTWIFNINRLGFQFQNIHIQNQSLMGCFLSSNVNVFSKTELVVMNDRRIIKEVIIANGAYGEVWKCKEAQTNTLYALKIIRLQSKQLRQMYEKEARVLKKMKQIKSKGIIKLIEQCKSSHKQNQRYQSGQMLLEFGHISLFDQILNKRFSITQISKILTQILQGVQELHSQKIFHLDLKPQNIILIGDKYKICDLGSCIQGPVDFKTISKPYKTVMQQFIQSNSTLIYRSPQMIDTNNKVIDGRSDMWMVGLIGYFMLYRKQPFEGMGKLAIISPIDYPTSGQLQNILKNLLKINPDERTNIQQTLTQLKKVY